MDRQDGIYTIDDIFLFFLLMYVNGTGVRIPPTTLDPILQLPLKH